MRSVTLNLFREMLSMHPLPFKIGDVREFTHSPRCSVCVCVCWQGGGSSNVCLRQCNLSQGHLSYALCLSPLLFFPLLLSFSIGFWGFHRCQLRYSSFIIDCVHWHALFPAVLLPWLRIDLTVVDVRFGVEMVFTLLCPCAVLQGENMPSWF